MAPVRGYEGISEPDDAQLELQSGWAVEMYDIIAEKLGFEFNIQPARSEGIAVYNTGEGINGMAFGLLCLTPERRLYSNVPAVSRSGPTQTGPAPHPTPS